MIGRTFTIVRFPRRLRCSFLFHPPLLLFLLQLFCSLDCVPSEFRVFFIKFRTGSDPFDEGFERMEFGVVVKIRGMPREVHLVGECATPLEPTVDLVNDREGLRSGGIRDSSTWGACVISFDESEHEDDGEERLFRV